MSRKLIVVAGIAMILALAGLPSIVVCLERAGVIDWARWVRVEYVTGTAVTVIVVLLLLLPDRGRWPWRPRIGVRSCPVCEARLTRPGRYCPTCGSRV